MEKRKIKAKKGNLLAVIGVIAFIIVGSQIKNFLTVSNLFNIVRQSSITSIVAYGMAMVIIVKGIDLSSGGVMAFCAMVGGMLMKDGMPMPVALLIGIAVGILMGLFNGLMVDRLEVPAFITTLVIGNIAQGLCLVVNQGQSLGGFPEPYVFIGNGLILGFPVSNYLTVVLCIISAIIMGKTRMGTHIYALGGNDSVVKQQGISTAKINYFVFAFSGMCAAFAGILLSAQMNTVHPEQGGNYQLDAVAACVIGGVNMAGGEGKVYFALLGALVIGAMRNALNLLGIYPFYQNLVVGTMIILIVAASMLKKQKDDERSKVF